MGIGNLSVEGELDVAGLDPHAAVGLQGGEDVLEGCEVGSQAAPQAR
jgi:hypothetical protein